MVAPVCFYPKNNRDERKQRKYRLHPTLLLHRLLPRDLRRHHHSPATHTRTHVQNTCMLWSSRWFAFNDDTFSTTRLYHTCMQKHHNALYCAIGQRGVVSACQLTELNTTQLWHEAWLRLKHRPNIHIVHDRKHWSDFVSKTHQQWTACCVGTEPLESTPKQESASRT